MIAPCFECAKRPQPLTECPGPWSERTLRPGARCERRPIMATPWFQREQYFPEFRREDFIRFACDLIAHVEDFDERLERLEVQLLDEQFARPAAERGDDA